MPEIKLETYIKSDLETCFDLARSIDLHKISTAKSNEIAIDGKTSGLIALNEFVTWEATHFGLRQHLSSKITAFEKPLHFRDEMLKGIFKSIVHDHYFELKDGKVLMTDIFKYESPYGFLGKLVNKLILNRYLTKLLMDRNNTIKEFAETEKWRTLLN